MLIDRNNFEAKSNISNKIQGWMSENDFLSLHFLLQQYNEPIDVLEIGTWKGRSTIFSMLSLPEKSLFTAIDIFQGGNDHAMDYSICGTITNQQLENITRVNFNNCRNEYRNDLDALLIKADSKELLPRWISGTFERRFDLIFLDGDHRYVGFGLDFINSLKLLKPNGILCGHDFGNSGPDVTKFLLMLGNDLFYQIDPASSVWILQQDKVEEAKNRVKRIEKIIEWKSKK